MFVFNRSALAVLAPIALLLAMVLWSNLSDAPPPAAASAGRVESVPQGKVARVAQARNNAG